MDVLGKIDFGFYLSLFLRRLPLFLGVTIVTATVLALLTVVWPLSYQATAKVLVESPQIPTDLAKSTVPTGAGERFQIIQQDVLSNENLLALANQFGIYARRPGMSRTDMYDDMSRRVSIVPALTDTGSGSSAMVYSISFTADRPDVAANLVNELVTMILNKDVRLRTERASDTVAFFTKETQRLDGLLQALDGRMLAFKDQHINALPESIDFRRNQQVALQKRTLDLSQEEASLRKRQADLATRPLDISASAATPEEQSLQALRQSLAQQQAVFAETSPTIVSLRARIAELEASMAHPAAAGPLTSRDLEISDIQDRLAAIAAERTSIEKTNADLVSSINQTPANEIALNSMLRDHQNLQAQYDAAIARLAEASTGQQIELLLKGERLSLIESAVPPQTPQGPKQRVLLLASGLAGLLLGLATVVVPELLNRRIRRPSELVDRLQIVPFITVPFIEPSTRRRPRFAVGLGAIIAVPALLVAVNEAPHPTHDNLSAVTTDFGDLP